MGIREETRPRASVISGFHEFITDYCSNEDIQTPQKHYIAYYFSLIKKRSWKEQRPDPCHTHELSLENMLLPGWRLKEFLDCRSSQRKKNQSSLIQVYNHIHLSRWPQLQPGWKCENATLGPACYLKKKKSHGPWLRVMKPSCNVSSPPTLVGKWGYKPRPLLRQWGMKMSGSSLDTWTSPWCKVKLINSGGQEKQMFSTAECEVWGKWLYGPLAGMLTFECYTQEVIR